MGIRDNPYQEAISLVQWLNRHGIEPNKQPSVAIFGSRDWFYNIWYRKRIRNNRTVKREAQAYVPGTTASIHGAEGPVGGWVVVNCTPVAATSEDLAANQPESSFVFPIPTLLLRSPSPLSQSIGAMNSTSIPSRHRSTLYVPSSFLTRLGLRRGSHHIINSSHTSNGDSKKYPLYPLTLILTIYIWKILFLFPTLENPFVN